MSDPRDEFIGFIADRFQGRHATPLPRDEAVDLAKSTLEAFEDMESPFGHPDFDWGEDGAHCIADEEIHAGWESAPCG